MLNFKKINSIAIPLCLVFIVLKINDKISFWYLFILIIVWLSLTIIGSFHIKWNYFLSSKHNNYSTTKNAIALTFDDGPNPNFTLKILELLEQYNAKATFFCVGKHIEKYPNIVKEIIEKGHEIGNHSYSHSNNYGFLSTKKVVLDLKKTQQLIKVQTGKKNTIFRPPFGVTNPNIAKAIKQLNLQAIGWSIRSLDTVAKSPEKVYQKIKKNLKKGAIILLHDTSDLTLVVLEQLLQTLKENQIKTITITQLFNLQTNV